MRLCLYSWPTPFFCCFFISVYTSRPRFDQQTSVDFHRLLCVCQCHIQTNSTPQPPVEWNAGSSPLAGKRNDSLASWRANAQIYSPAEWERSFLLVYSYTAAPALLQDRQRKRVVGKIISYRLRGIHRCWTDFLAHSCLSWPIWRLVFVF